MDKRDATFWTRFLDFLGRVLPAESESFQERMANLNPDKIHLEDVQTLLTIGKSTAYRICETAVRQGSFEKYDVDGTTVYRLKKG